MPVRCIHNNIQQKITMQTDAALAIIQNPRRNATDIDALGSLLNELILHDFESLLYLLYRVDVSEREVRKILPTQPTADAGKLLAALLLQRQAQKEHTRAQMRQQDADIPEDERW